MNAYGSTVTVITVSKCDPYPLPFYQSKGTFSDNLFMSVAESYHELNIKLDNPKKPRQTLILNIIKS